MSQDDSAAELPRTSNGSAGTPDVRLERVLGVRDLVFLNLSAILGFRWLSTAAQIGPSSLTLWVVAALLFFIPTGLIVPELSARIPGDGGPYLWASKAFGPLHGFAAGWCYLVTNLVFLPALLLYSSVEGHTKNEKAFFTLAAARAGLPASRCIFVGEDAKERETAASAGFQVSFHPLHMFHVLKLVWSG